MTTFEAKDGKLIVTCGHIQGEGVTPPTRDITADRIVQVLAVVGRNVPKAVPMCCPCGVFTTLDADEVAALQKAAKAVQS